ncbi:MAG: hypothetical protein JW746_00565 [Candidatus Krumholzibacteriota bacterium]|nr:hypothetical protein [Candidatus Krumholzibacteriota bacterium]
MLKKAFFPIFIVIFAVFTHTARVCAGEAVLIVNFPSISPNGDGIKDALSATIILAGPVDSLILTIEEYSGTGVFDTLFFLSPSPQGEYSAIWHGTDSLGTPLGEGEYMMKLYESTASVSEIVTRTVIIDTTAPEIAIDRIEPGSFSPGYPDTSADVSVYYIVTGYETGSDLTITIIDPDDESDYYELEVTGDGDYSYSFEPEAGWPDGIYTIELMITDEAGNSSISSGALNIDTAGPIISILTYLPSDTVAAPLDIKGFCHDRSGTKDTLDLSWGQYDATNKYVESAYFLPDSTWLQADTLYWRFDLPDSVTGVTSYDEGTYTFKMTAEDNYGHRKKESRTFTLDRTAPPPPVVNNNSGRVLLPELELDIIYDDEDTEFLSIFNVFEGDTTENHILHLMPHTIDLEEGTTYVWVTAEDKAGNVSGQSNIVTVYYDVSYLVEFPEVFRKPDNFQIITTETAQEIIIEIYDLGGEEVRTIYGWGPSTSFQIGWDLLNNDGDSVNNGPFLVVLTIDYGTRKTVEKNFIAVVR